MSYINKTNTVGEEIVATFGFTKLAYLNPIKVLLFPIAYPLTWFNRWCCNIGVTNKRFVWKEGFISRDTWEIRLDAIEGVDIKNTFFGRIFGYGELRISGRGEKNIKISGLANIMGVKRAVEAARDEFISNPNR